MSDLNFILDSLNGKGITASANSELLPQKSLMEVLLEEATAFNQSLPESLQASKSTINMLLRREEGGGHPVAQRAVAQYFNTIENPDTKTPTRHKDLLPKSHPMSTRWVSSFRVRDEVASYYTTDKRIDGEDNRALVASALVYEPDSAQRMFYNEVLLEKTQDLSLFAIIEEADRMIDIRKENHSD